MPRLPLTGYKYKREQQAAADRAKDTADAAEKTRRDRDYALRRARETAANTVIAGEGAQACRDAAAAVRADISRLETERERIGLVDKGTLREKNREIKAATQKAELLERLAAMDDPGRASAIQAANQAVTAAEQQLQDATAEAARLLAEADRLEQAAQALPDLNASWERDHAVSSTRRLEADLRNMRADLTRLGANAPPNAVTYCDALEAKVDHDAHHVPCPRCHIDHGIDRTSEAKAAVAAQIAELERLAKLPDDTGLTEQQKRDRSIGRALEALREGGEGKMIGVLLCRNEASGEEIPLRAFSGDIGGQDDVAGWCPHIPPDSSMLSANKVAVPLRALPPTQGAPHGVCAAPKMIQEAHRQGLTIVGIAEAWYGGGEAQPHGALVASCTTCKSNLDVQLCPAYPPT